MTTTFDQLAQAVLDGTPATSDDALAVLQAKVRFGYVADPEHTQTKLPLQRLAAIGQIR